MSRFYTQRQRDAHRIGFGPFYAAAICLLANTAPVAFGSIGIPIATLTVTRGLPVDHLSAGVGRVCAAVSLFVPRT
jgi:lactate permease